MIAAAVWALLVWTFAAGAVVALVVRGVIG